MDNPIAAKLAAALRLIERQAIAEGPHCNLIVQYAREALREYDDAKGREGEAVQEIPDTSNIRKFPEKVDRSKCGETDNLYANFGEQAPTNPVAQAVPVAWQPIETAPKDGTVVDLW